MNLSAEVLTALFGGGGLASLAFVAKAMQAKKDGFNRARAEHIQDLANWRSELQTQVQELTKVVEVYRRRAAGFEYQLRQNGIEPTYPAGDETPSRGLPRIRIEE